jgi:hypothetical protein
LIDDESGKLIVARLHELRRISEGLRFASRLLLLAVFLELPFVVGFVVRVARPTWEWEAPAAVFNGLWLSSTLCAVVGFVVVSRRLGLWSEAMDNFAEFVDRTRVYGTAKLTAGAQFLFMGLLLIPLFNLPAILWARAQAQRARREIERVVNSGGRRR